MNIAVSISAQTTGQSRHLARLEALRLFERFRPHGSRVALFAMLSTMARDDEETSMCRTGGAQALAEMERALSLIDAPNPPDGITVDAQSWVQKTVEATEGAGEATRDMATRMRRLHEHAPEDKNGIYEQAIDGGRFAAGTFGKLYSDVIDGLIASLEKDRATRAEDGRRIVQDAHEAITEIKRISRSVRLISLNAAVEAARVGDDGRGFAVIAGEIKALAEAIDDAGARAGASLGDLLSIAED